MKREYGNNNNAVTVLWYRSNIHSHSFSIENNMSWRLLTKDRKVINLRFIWEQIIKKRIIPKIENGLEMDIEMM